MKESTKKRYLTQFESCLNSELSFEEYVKQKCKHKHDVSKLKNSLDFVKINNQNLKKSDKEKFKKICEEEMKKKDKYRKEPEEQFKLRTILNKINLIKSKRLKLAYRLQLISGLRVSEIANLTLEDIKLKGDELIVDVIKGKGDKDRRVECLHDEYVISGLLEIEPKKNGKLFCTAKHMMQEATKNGFHTHDLRKVYAQVIYYNSFENKADKVKNLQDRLGHAYNNKTYLKYINRDINLYYTKYNI